jgi:hypothetical protein
MPIKRTYVPPFEDVMGAAQAVGAGEFNERRRREDLALLELGQRDLAQRRALVADQQRQANAIAANQQEQAARMQLAGWEAAMRQGNIQQARQWQLDDRGVARQDELADRNAANVEFDRREAAQFEHEWELGNINAAEKGINAGFGQWLKQLPNIDPVGRQKLGKLTAKWQAIQGARANMPPEAYKQMLGEFAGEIDRSGIADHINKPLTPAEQRQKFDSDTITIEPGDPSGKPPGLYGYDRNGTPKQISKYEEPRSKQEEAFEAHKKSFVGKKNKVQTGIDEDGQPIVEERDYTAEEIVKMWEVGQEADALARKKGLLPPAPGAAPQTGQPPKTVLPVAGSTADLSDAEIAIHLQTNGFPPANIDRAAIARHEAAGAPDPILAAAQEQQARRVPEPQPAAAIPRFTAENIDAEYEKLPAGAQYLAPDGQLRTKAAAPPVPKKPLKTPPQPAAAKPVEEPQTLTGSILDFADQVIPGAPLAFAAGGSLGLNVRQALDSRRKRKEEAKKKPKGKDLLANKPDRVRKRSFERDETGRIRKEIETYTDPDTGDTITVEQLVDRDERGQIVGTTVYERRAKAA